MSVTWHRQCHPELSEVEIMFLPIEVARLVEQERRQQSERRIRWLSVIREQRWQASAPVRPLVEAQRPGGQRTGPHRAYDTGPRG